MRAVNGNAINALDVFCSCHTMISDNLLTNACTHMIERVMRHNQCIL